MHTMFNRARRIIRFALTLLMLAFAAFAVVGLWEHYMVAPWTRDGQVRVQVADIAPQVPGQIVKLLVKDDQFVHKGDLLYVIDQGDYKVALDLAKADVASKAADLEVKKNENERRQKLTDLAASTEEKQIYEGSYAVAEAAHQTALANLEQAQLNMQRTEVRSTVNGFVTNLLLRVGDYANKGSPNIAIVDSDSYWVAGYFEETKLGSFQVGDAAEVEFMGFEQKLTGHVESITRGISAPNATVSTQGLPSVEAVYTWVRLAQRIPVRIKIDSVPPTINAGCRFDSDGDCHSLAAPTPMALYDIRTLWSLIKESLSQSWRHSAARSSRAINARVFRTDAASELEFCRSRHGEAIICHCSLLQSAHPSLSTSIVELHASDGSKQV
jgi:multidrug resistance efflux pump